MTKKKIIIVKLAGGLGNQLFQFFFGISIAKKKSAKVIFDVSFFKGAKDRKLIIEHILDNDLKKILFKKRFLFLNIFTKFPYYREKNKFFEKIESVKPYQYFQGYWQNQKYFEDIFNPSKILKFKSIKPYYQKWYKLLKELNFNVCFIHIRRGDYINNNKTKKYHGICSDKYYINAMDKQLSYKNDLVFYIFSDNVEITKNLFSSYKNIYFISNNFLNSELDEMYLMSLCKYGILSNSSFSWWSAYLNFNNVKKHIICPRYWYLNKDLIKKVNPALDDWEKLENF